MAAGDVLLFSRRITLAAFRRDPFGTFMCALIHLTTRSRYNHAALDIGDGMMVEATSAGVAVNPIASSRGGDMPSHRDSSVRRGILTVTTDKATNEELDANASGRWRRALERLANLVLDRPYADPDDDVAKEARAALKHLAAAPMSEPGNAANP